MQLVAVERIALQFTSAYDNEREAKNAIMKCLFNNPVFGSH